MKNQVSGTSLLGIYHTISQLLGVLLFAIFNLFLFVKAFDEVETSGTHATK